MTRLPSAERRRQLIRAAIKAMARDGVANTTTRSIAAEAGVSLSVFHYCFDSKQDLVEAVIVAITENSVAVVREALQPRTTLTETVRAGFQAYWNHVRDHPEQHLLTYELTQYALRRPGFEHLARRQYTLYADTYTRLIAELRRSMDVRLSVPDRTLAHYLAAMTDGLTIQHLVLGDAAPSADVLDLVAAHVAALVRPAGGQDP